MEIILFIIVVLSLRGRKKRQVWGKFRGWTFYFVSRQFPFVIGLRHGNSLRKVDARAQIFGQYSQPPFKPFLGL